MPIVASGLQSRLRILGLCTKADRLWPRRLPTGRLLFRTRFRPSEIPHDRDINMSIIHPAMNVHGDYLKKSISDRLRSTELVDRLACNCVVAACIFVIASA